MESGSKFAVVSLIKIIFCQLEKSELGMIDLIVLIVMIYPKESKVIVVFIENIVAQRFFKMMLRSRIEDKYSAFFKAVR